MNNEMISKSHILIIDDDSRICDLLFRYLRENDFVVMTANDAYEAQEKMKNFVFDALVVDVMMPGQTGTEFIQSIRNQGNNIPALLLTALGEVEDRISGLESGADDYLSKPFEPKELVLRLKSLLRRVEINIKQEAELFNIGSWNFDMKHDELVSSQSDEVMRLTSVEANLLRALLETNGEVVTREDLAKRCDLDAGERTIDVQVTRLRKKLEENSKSPRYLQTIRGKGYLLRAEAKS